MINVVIAGNNALSQHIASILAQEQHNVFIIDEESDSSHEAAPIANVTIQKGSATDWELLEDFLEFSPNIFVALTDHDETNLVACAIAKQLQYPRAVAYVHDSRFLEKARIDFNHIFSVDYFICPEVTIAQDILKYVISPGSLALENFAYGALQLRTLLIPEDWKEGGVPLRDLDFKGNIIVGLLRRSIRDEETYALNPTLIFPHGEDVILPGDEVTFIGETDAVSALHEKFGITQKEIRSVVIMGGSDTALQLAKLLSARNINVRIIEKDYAKCTSLSERLPNCTIMHHNTLDLDFLRLEKIGKADLIVACTNQDEHNVLAAFLGKEVGCQEIIVMLSNLSCVPILERVGIKHIVSPRISATNLILSQMFSGRVNSLISLYENQAEVLEITVSMNSKIAGIPISELGPYLPKDFLIVMIQNRGRIMIAHGNRIISPGDTVIVVTDPKNIEELEQIF